MARIIGGIAASHTPTIGFAYDKQKFDDPAWRPIFENFAPLADWLAQKKPDVLVVIYNDHVTSRDWQGLMRYGAIFFMLEKLGAVVGVSNLHIYAAMRGQSLEDFQKTRNAPNALYSVVGKSGGAALDWDKAKTWQPAAHDA